MIRIYLNGRMTIEADGVCLDANAFPRQQGRRAFAFLVTERGNPVSRAVLAEAIWPGVPPRAWESAVSSIISKLRSLLARAGLDGTTTLRSGGGCYELNLPPHAWIDHEIAANSIHEAEAALKDGNFAAAYGPSAIAHHIARRPFLPGEEGEWIERRRDKLESVLLRALEVRSEVYLWNGEYPLAVEAAREVIARRPFRETAYRHLMRAHAAAGDAAEALWVYEQCRTLIAQELGASPSPATQAIQLQVLQAPAATS